MSSKFIGFLKVPGRRGVAIAGTLRCLGVEGKLGVFEPIAIFWPADLHFFVGFSRFLHLTIAKTQGEIIQ